MMPLIKAHGGTVLWTGNGEVLAFGGRFEAITPNHRWSGLGRKPVLSMH